MITEKKLQYDINKVAEKTHQHYHQVKYLT